jgi:hypothetical protein
VVDPLRVGAPRIRIEAPALPRNSSASERELAWANLVAALIPKLEEMDGDLIETKAAALVACAAAQRAESFGAAIATHLKIEHPLAPPPLPPVREKAASADDIANAFVERIEKTNPGFLSPPKTPSALRVDSFMRGLGDWFARRTTTLLGKVITEGLKVLAFGVIGWLVHHLFWKH